MERWTNWGASWLLQSDSQCVCNQDVLLAPGLLALILSHYLIQSLEIINQSDQTVIYLQLFPFLPELVGVSLCVLEPISCLNKAVQWKLSADRHAQHPGSDSGFYCSSRSQLGEASCVSVRKGSIPHWSSLCKVFWDNQLKVFRMGHHLSSRFCGQSPTTALMYHFQSAFPCLVLQGKHTTMLTARAILHGNGSSA